MLQVRITAVMNLMRPSIHQELLSQSPGRLLKRERSVITAVSMEALLTARIRRQVRECQQSSKSCLKCSPVLSEERRDASKTCEEIRMSLENRALKAVIARRLLKPAGKREVAAASVLDLCVALQSQFVFILVHDTTA